MSAAKTLRRLLSGTADAAVRFDDLTTLLVSLGFDEPVRGSHHVFRRQGIEEKINLQREGGHAKPYQVKQSALGHSKIQVSWRIMNKYKVIIFWSDEDQAFVAEVPELPGCSAHGDSQEAALANAQEAIRLWIDAAHEFGDPVPEPKGRRLIVA